MLLRIEKKLWLYFGKPFGGIWYSPRAFCHLEIGWGWIESSDPGLIPWRHWWTWSPNRPHFIRRNGRIVGYEGFKWSWIWRRG